MSDQCRYEIRGTSYKWEEATFWRNLSASPTAINLILPISVEKEVVGDVFSFHEMSWIKNWINS
jgi:hypothetical protein